MRTMLETIVTSVTTAMLPILNNGQMRQLQEVLKAELTHAWLAEGRGLYQEPRKSSDNLIESFLSAKAVEGCSKRTIAYYQTTLVQALDEVDKPVEEITTDDLRHYLCSYPEKHGAKSVTVDNVRRVLSSFFSWLEDEDYILKSPVRRIHKIRSCRPVKPTYTDEELERMRDSCSEIRDLAMVDFLTSTGVRVGELVGINRNDVDLDRRECVVLGKGNKQRVVYFDARTKVHLSVYLSSRDDDCPALFVTLRRPSKRLKIHGVETRLRKLGVSVGIERTHPHKFRRTMATRAIDKGMPIEQVQRLLGHQRIDTTLMYAMVDQNNVKMAHRKFVC